MTYRTAQPPTMSTYISPREKFVFRRMLAVIHASDKKNGTQTPTTTLAAILAGAKELGVDTADLVNQSGGDR